MANRSGLLQMGFMALAIWVITADPVEQLLPVPMPELNAGPDTTRLAGVTVRDGVPDYATVLDARDHDRLSSPGNPLGAITAAVGTARWSAGEQAAVEPWLLGRKPLPPALLLERKGSDESTATALDDANKAMHEQFTFAKNSQEWLAACAPALEALHQITGDGELVVPQVLFQGDPTANSISAGDRLEVCLLNLGLASVLQTQAAADRGAVAGLAEASRLTQRIATWLLDSHGSATVAGALELEVRLHEAWLVALADHGGSAMRTAISEWSTTVPPRNPMPALSDRARIFATTITARRCAKFRAESAATETAKYIHRNAPPDPNVALNEVQQFCDRSALAFARVSDVATLAQVDPNTLPSTTDIIVEAFDSRPLAERLLFSLPVAQRRAEMARRFALQAILDVSAQQHNAISRARALIRRQAAVRVALAVLDHQDRTGALPRNASELPKSLQSVFIISDTAIALTCVDGQCTITTTGDKPVTLWRFPPPPPVIIP